MKSANWFASIIAIGLTVAACTDDGGTAPTGVDAGTSAGGDAGAAGHDAGAAARVTAYALGTDSKSVGILSAIDIRSLTVSKDVVAAVASTDPVVRSFGGLLYIVNRFGFDNVTIVDPATGKLVDQISTGAGTNPQDVAVRGDTIYVAALASADVLVIDAAHPSADPARIDLSEFAGADGTPDANSLYLVGDDLYVTIGLLDTKFVSHGGKVVVIDTTTNTVSTSFDLTYHNPFGLLQPYGDELLVTTTEDFANGPGCLERIKTSGEPASAGCLVENSDLGGYAGVYGADGDRVWLAVSTSFTAAKLVTVAADGTIGEAITPASQKPTDLAVCPDGRVVVADGDGGGLRVYDTDGGEVTTGVLDIGQPPVFANGIVCLDLT